MSSSAPDDAKTPRRTSNTGNVRGLPAAVVEGRGAAEAARRRGAGRAVRRVALGRVENGALRARGGREAPRYFSRCFCGPTCLTGPWALPLERRREPRRVPCLRVRCVDLNSLSGTSAAERLRPRPTRVLSVPRGLVGAGASFLSAPCAASQAQLKQAVGNFFSKPKDVPPGVTLRHGRLWTPTKPGEEEKKFKRDRPKRPELRVFCPSSPHGCFWRPGGLLRRPGVL